MWAVLMGDKYCDYSEYIQTIEPGNTAAHSSEILSKQYTVNPQYLALWETLKYYVCSVKSWTYIL